MREATRLTIRESAWSRAAEQLLSDVSRDPLVGVATIRGIVESGRGRLFEVWAEEALVFAYVVTVNVCEKGSEAVVAASAGGLPGVSFPKVILPEIERIYSFCDRLKITASRKGMERILEGRDYKKQAVIYTKELINVLR